MSPLTEQQASAVNSIDANVLVSAGAGSGKTHVLVERFIEILKRDPALSVNHIVAVTYTKKAAREMRMRLKARMEELVEQADEEHKVRWIKCRTDIDSGKIGTIHALCESLLKNFPAEAQVDPKFEILDELEAAELLFESVDKSMATVAALPERDLLMNFPVEQVRKWLSSTIRSSLEFEGACQGLPGFSDSQLEEHFFKLLKEIQLSVIGEIVCLPVWKSGLNFLQNNRLSDSSNKLNDMAALVSELMQPLSQFALNLDETADDDLKAAMGNLHDIDKTINLRVGGNKEDAKAIKQVLGEVRDCVRGYVKHLPAEISPHDGYAFQCLRALMSLRERALRLYAQGKKTRQKLDFNDLILYAYNLLREPESAARRFYNETVRAILVDEFQDTNAMQAQLISLLAGERTRLFLIGDDKQSIYKFQGADVSVFNRWKRCFAGDNQDLEVIGSRQVEILNTSFRSHPGIVNFVNQLFERLFEGNTKSNPHRAAHQALKPSRFDDPDAARVEVVVFNSQEQTALRNAGYAEAQALGNWIAEKMSSGAMVWDKDRAAQRPINYGDFAVLVQRNDDFLPIEYVLDALEMPYVTMGGASYLQRQEIYDLENLLKFLWCPTDSQALLGALRSPMFGLSDDTIQSLSGRGTLWAALQQEVEQPDGGFLLPVKQLLKLLIEESHCKPLPDLIRSVIQKTRYDTVVLALPNGRQRCRNLWKLLKIANDFAELSVGDFVNRLESMRELGIKQSAAPVDSGNSIKLMTIHSSKGLEFPAVLLPVMDVDAYRAKGKLIFHRRYGIAFDNSRNEGDENKPAFFKLARFLEKDMAVSEKKRLFYVAATRARDYLAFFLDRQTKNADSFAAWLWEAMQLDVSLALSVPENSAAVRLSLIGAERNVDYLLKFAAPATDALKSASSIDSLLENNGGLGSVPVRMNLLESAILSLTKPQVPWQQLLRITPDASSARPLLPATVLGNYFHLLMEHLTQKLKPLSRQTLDSIAQSESMNVIHPQVKEALVDEGLSLLDRFFGSPLYELMKKARLRLHEAPYVMLNDDHGMQSKRPDLLLLDEDECWHVIDYKTDNFALPEVAVHAREHHRQLAAYVSDLQVLTGIVASPYLYFAQHAILYSLSESLVM